MQARLTMAVHIFIDNDLEMKRIILIFSASCLTRSCVLCIQLLSGMRISHQETSSYSLASLLLFCKRGALLIGLELSHRHLEPEEELRELYSWKMLSLHLNPPNYTTG